MAQWKKRKEGNILKAGKFARRQVMLKAWMSLNGQDEESRRKNMLAKKFLEGA